MAQNSISYEGRVVETKTRPHKLTQSANGMTILEFTVAEQHSMKKGRAKKDPAMKQYVEDDYNVSKTDDDYINTTVSWHRMTVFGEKADALATNDEFGHGALIVVDNATYVEEGDWETRDGVKRAGRPETIGDNKGEIEIKFPPRDPQGAWWDGVSALPKPGGGGGPRQDREVSDSEGF